MRIALGQTNIHFESKTENYNKLLAFARESSEKECRLLLLPEMSFTGFSVNIGSTAEEKGETVSVVRQIAIEHNICIGFGWCKAISEKAENHYTILNESGEILSDYIKLHPFSYGNEDKFFIQGDRLQFFVLDEFCLSTFICYDLRFPEIFQAASLQADIIIVPANWPAARAEHWKTLLRARAIENQAYIVGVNCVGYIGNAFYTGDSCIIDPLGNTLTSSAHNEELIILDIRNDTAEYRNNFPMKKDRRCALYSQLSQGGIING